MQCLELLLTVLKRALLLVMKVFITNLLVPHVTVQWVDGRGYYSLPTVVG
jgi:hypothetical protein